MKRIHPCSAKRNEEGSLKRARYGVSLSKRCRLINQSINQSINQQISQVINQSVNQSINQVISEVINQSINQQISQVINQSINQQISQYNSLQYSTTELGIGRQKRLRILRKKFAPFDVFGVLTAHRWFVHPLNITFSSNLLFEFLFLSDLERLDKVIQLLRQKHSNLKIILSKVSGVLKLEVSLFLF